MGEKLAFAVSFIPKVAPDPFIHSFVQQILRIPLHMPCTSGYLGFFTKFSLSLEFVAKILVETLGPDDL